MQDKGFFQSFPLNQKRSPEKYTGLRFFQTGHLTRYHLGALRLLYDYHVWHFYQYSYSMNQ